MTTLGNPRPGLARDLLVATLVGAGLTAAFWWPLLVGAGFVGGDTYNYFFPLKHFYAEGLKAGELRLWDPAIGNGVPTLAESQTGVLYPPYLLAYRLLPLNAAYSAVFLVHYALAFVASVALARLTGARLLPSLAAASVFVFGWFPPRACLEWAIVTGAWMPIILCFVWRWLETGRRRVGVLISLSVALQLFAGHFQLAFVTLLAAVLVVAAAPVGTIGRRWGAFVFVAAGFLLAAVQLLPTWELRSLSQRATQEFAESTGFGAIPLGYLVQLIAPYWVYVAPEDVINRVGGETNKIEAHLFVGLLPLLVVLVALLTGRVNRRWAPGLLLVGGGLVLGTGVVSKYLAAAPGFSFFRYPGRYGLLAQLGVSLLLAQALERSIAARPRLGQLLALSVLTVSLAEFYWVGGKVQYVAMVNPPPLAAIERSEVLKRLSPTDRVLAMDGNTLALSGAACVPPYLGMGPAPYYAIWGAMPDLFHGKSRLTNDVAATLKKMGVTKILTEAPLASEPPLRLAWSGFDPFLHPRWGRARNEPLFLYELEDAPGRAYFADSRGQPLPRATTAITRFAPSRVELVVRSDRPGRLILTDLAYPGWTVTLDGKAVSAAPDTLLREVDVPAGEHHVVWQFWSWSTVWGAAISIATGATLWIAVSRGKSAGAAF